MITQIDVNSADFARIEKALEELPRAMRHRVVSRALKRVASSASVPVVRDVAELTQLQQKLIRQRLSTSYDIADGSISMSINSRNIPLTEIGGRRMRKVLERTEKQYRRMLKKRGAELKGSYRAAFLAKIKHDKGVFQREGAARGPVRELYGPNPAHAVLEKPERYQNLMSETIQRYLMPRIVHELDQALKI